jgi:hypothetical protein
MRFVRADADDPRIINGGRQSNSDFLLACLESPVANCRPIMIQIASSGLFILVKGNAGRTATASFQDDA